MTQILTEDITTGIALGVSETPFVFLNGVELEGITSDPGLIRGAIERVLKSEQQRLAAGQPSLAGSFADDSRPPAADERVLKLWESAKEVSSVPPRGSELVQLGNAEGPHRVLLFQEPTYADAAAMWQALRELADLRDDVSIEFYLYPMNPTQNAGLAEWQKPLYPRSASVSRFVTAMAREELGSQLGRVFEAMRWSVEPDEGEGRLLQILASQAGPVQRAPRSFELPAE